MAVIRSMKDSDKLQTKNDSGGHQMENEWWASNKERQW